MTFTYEHKWDGSVKHIVSAEPDATLCEEYIDITDDEFSSEEPPDTVGCLACDQLARVMVLSQARSDVARELGVDESEVF